MNHVLLNIASEVGWFFGSAGTQVRISIGGMEILSADGDVDTDRRQRATPDTTIATGIHCPQGIAMSDHPKGTGETAGSAKENVAPPSGSFVAWSSLPCSRPD